jgi:DNA polymerase alpha subunit A
MIQHTVVDGVFSLRLVWRLQVLLLTKQLSNLAGNLWWQSLQNRRAERNEWLGK